MRQVHEIQMSLTEGTVKLDSDALPWRRGRAWIRIEEEQMDGHLTLKTLETQTVAIRAKRTKFNVN